MLDAAPKVLDGNWDVNLEEDDDYKNYFVNAMLDAAPKVLDGNWDVKLEALFLTFATSDKCYSYDIVLDLLLLIGKTLSRQQWLPKDIQKQLSRGISEALTQLEPQMPETFYLEVPRRGHVILSSDLIANIHSGLH
ncbi:hypothetical protein AAC387_Pa12g2384 [Persea americana]